MTASSEGMPALECAEALPAVSVIVPAWNEEALLPGTLRAIAAAAAAVGVPHEVIVVDDASADRTAVVAAEHGARVLSVCERRISRVRNAGAAAARAGILVFVDADTTLTAEAFRGALDAVAHGAVGGGAPVVFDGALPAYGRVLAPVGILVQRVFRGRSFLRSPENKEIWYGPRGE